MHFYPLNEETHNAPSPTARAILMFMEQHVRKRGTRVKIVIPRLRSLIQACRLAGVDCRENTGQEGEPHRRAHRSLGDYASSVQGVAAFTAFSIRSRLFSKYRLSRRKRAHLLSLLLISLRKFLTFATVTRVRVHEREYMYRVYDTWACVCICICVHECEMRNGDSDHVFRRQKKVQCRTCSSSFGAELHENARQKAESMSNDLD